MRDQKTSELAQDVDAHSLQRLVSPIPFVDSIVHGDNCDVLGQLPRNCIDLVVTSPPYDDLRTYGGHSWDFYGVAWQLARVLKPGGVIVWVVADQMKNGSESGTSMRQALHFHALGLNLHDTMAYEKMNGAMGSDRHYLACWEYMFVLSKGVPKTVNLLRDRKNVRSGKESALRHGRKPNGETAERTIVELAEYGRRKNIWQYAVGGDQEVGDHPAVFPEGLAKDHILSWSNPGDIVCDPFSGSGTTVKAAKELNRHWLGIEINETYIKNANARTAQDVLGLG